jgi:hypothetical protein
MTSRPHQEHPLTDLEQRYRNQIHQMSELYDEMKSLRDFMVANGAGTYTAITATLGEHEADIAELKARCRG